MSMLFNSSQASHTTAWLGCSAKQYGYETNQLIVATTVTFILGAFCLFGHLIGNTSSIRDTAFLASAILFINRDVVLVMASHMEAGSTVVYLLATLLVQIIITMATPKWRQQQTLGTSRPEKLWLKPMVFPCQTTHTRLFPEKHSFSYSYLFVGVPVTWEGSINNFLASGKEAAGTAWLSVNDKDYLARGRHVNSLRGKLTDYLLSQRVSVTRYPYAYLVTAPRFLGFSFNPISFWYLYDENMTLSAMILEVNNTFDERRMYFMERKVEHTSSPNKVFHTSWSKDFHVSPFNDRSGSYSLTAKDVRADRDAANVDNSIVLRDDADKAKLVARVFSTEPGIDPSALSKYQRWMFIVQWWWVGLLTNPRILREARILWVKKLEVYYRPEVFKTSIGRNENTTEDIVERCFGAFLAELINSEAKPVSISYLPAAGIGKGNILKLPLRTAVSDIHPIQSLDIHVLTPAFYSELVRSNSIDHVFTKFCFESADGEAMLHVSNHTLMRVLLRQYASKNDILPNTARPLTVNQWFVSWLRSGSVRSSLHTSLSKVLGSKEEQLNPSDFDAFVGLSHPYKAYKTYLWNVQRLLLADRTAFGSDMLLSLYGQMVRLACFWLVCQAVADVPFHSPGVTTLLSLAVCAAIFHWVNAFLTPVK